MKPRAVDQKWKDYATPTQCKYIDAVIEHGSMTAAAKALGLNYNTIRSCIESAQQRAQAKGWSPQHDMTHAVPDPFVVKGISTLYDEDGNARLQWVKTTRDGALVEQAMRESIAALAEEVTRADPIKAPKDTQKNLCNLYTMTDCHVGMRSWKLETGDNWDLDIAERTLIGAFEHLVKCSPPAHTAFVNQLGDFLHFDSLSPVTPTNGYILDGDGRYGKVVRVAVRVLRHVINEALKKHGEVIALMAEGNHDPASSVWLRHLFALLYENEPRIKVFDSEMPYYVHKHGDVMLAFHHGHLKKKEGLPLLFAAQFSEIWGGTKKRYCHTGHMHHFDEKEHSGMKVTQHPTMAARDAYASRHGFISERQMTSITYHREHGQVATNTVVPEMLEEA